MLVKRWGCGGLGESVDGVAGGGDEPLDQADEGVGIVVGGLGGDGEDLGEEKESDGFDDVGGGDGDEDGKANGDHELAWVDRNAGIDDDHPGEEEVDKIDEAPGEEGGN